MQIAFEITSSARLGYELVGKALHLAKRLVPDNLSIDVGRRTVRRLSLLDVVGTCPLHHDSVAGTRIDLRKPIDDVHRVSGLYESWENRKDETKVHCS